MVRNINDAAKYVLDHRPLVSHAGGQLSRYFLNPSTTLLLTEIYEALPYAATTILEQVLTPVLTIVIKLAQVVPTHHNFQDQTLFIGGGPSHLAHIRLPQGSFSPANASIALAGRKTQAIDFNLTA